MGRTGRKEGRGVRGEETRRKEKHKGGDGMKEVRREEQNKGRRERRR